MSALDVLRQVIGKLNKEEQKVARHFLTAFSSRGESGPNKSLILFDYICDEIVTKKEYSTRELELAIYGKSAQVAFPRLILRLKDKILDSITVDTNIERDGAYSERERVLLQLRKNLSHAQILLNRGLREIAVDMLNDVISKANKYEHFEECISALRVKMQVGVLNSGNDAHQTERELYTKILNALNAVQKAYHYYTAIIGETEFKSENGEPFFSQKLQDHIDELYEMFRLTGSANVAYYLYYVEAHHLQLQCRYIAASDILSEQLKIVEQHPAIYSKSRLAGVLINYAWNDIYLYRFTKAIEVSSQAEALVSEGSFNRFQCNEAKFYALFYQRQYDAALHILDELDRIDNSPTSWYRTGKRSYQRANVFFVQREYEKAANILRELNPIENDSLGWNIGVRILYIMTEIEQENTEKAVLRIENLRKHLEKLKKKGDINKRDRAKFEILRELINTRFSFTETHTRNSEMLEELRSDNTAMKWRILSPELIPFGQWFDSHLFKKKLVITIHPYKEQITISR